MSTGSLVTAGPDNTEPIQVTLVQVGDDGSEIPVTDFALDPGESADVGVEPGTEREDHLTLSVLHGTVTFDLNGVTQTVADDCGVQPARGGRGGHSVAGGRHDHDNTSHSVD